MSTQIDSPCTKVCTLDAAGAVCIGCLRTVAEIAGWGRMDAQSRAAVMARLAGTVRDRVVPGPIQELEPR